MLGGVTPPYYVVGISMSHTMVQIIFLYWIMIALISQHESSILCKSTRTIISQLNRLLERTVKGSITNKLN
jgi:hypothetical protein